VRFLRVIVAVLVALPAAVVLAPAAWAAESAESAGSTIQIRGLEYGVSTTEGRFGGTAHGALSGGWLATVAHEPLRKGKAVPVTGGSFTLRGRGPDLGGTFVRGTVKPLPAASTCEDERFDVTGTLALRGGGTGSFAVVLTHLRVRTGSGCRPYGAVVVGTLRVPSRAVT
jgi:hypothetical protein